MNSSNSGPQWNPIDGDSARFMRVSGVSVVGLARVGLWGL